MSLTEYERLKAQAEQWAYRCGLATGVVDVLREACREALVALMSENNFVARDQAFASLQYAIGHSCRVLRDSQSTRSEADGSVNELAKVGP